MTTTRIEFTGITESEARAALEGMIGGTGTKLYTSTVAGVVTGWINCDDSEVIALCQELDRDDRVVSYT